MAIFLVQIFHERTRDMALLRLHGTSYVKIWLSVFFEVIFCAVIGFVLAIILFYPVMYFLNLMGFGIKISLQFLNVLKVLIMVISLSSIMSIIGYFKVHKLSITDTLKFSE